MTGPTGRPRAVVVGGGLAGLAAAVGLADGGAEVTLLESRPRLGGATHSFSRGGLDVDNGQHVFLRCCTAYTGFLRRLGVAGDVTLQRRLAVPVLAPGDPSPAWLRRGPLPAPLHLAPGLLRYRRLGWRERAAVAPAVLALRRLDVDDAALDGESFGGWLTRHGQSPRAVDALWDLICTATLNTPPAGASLKLAAKVFQTGLLDDRAAADIGYATVPLGRLHGEAAGRALAEAGARVLLRTRVRAVEPSLDPSGMPGGFSGGFTVHTDDDRIDADAVVVAVPHDTVAGLLPAGTVAHQHRLTDLGTAPILNVHVVYDRRVTDLPFAAALATPAQWVFDRTAASGLAAAGGPEQYLAISVSAADPWIDAPVAELRRVFLGELSTLFPRARDAGVVDFFVTRERAATFRQAPGSHPLRAPTPTALPGLYLAGAWTDTGWPATMEGAVRSGRMAADAALAGLRTRRLPEGAAA